MANNNKKVFLKILKNTGIILSILILLISIIYLIVNESKPHGKEGRKADKYALKIMKSLNKKAWDTTHYIKWTFMDRHHYIWNKKRNVVQVKWENNTVLIDPDEKKGYVKKPDRIKDKKKKKLINKAHSYFYNDSFWLCAPYKLNDHGVKRELIKTENQQKALLVTFTQGGDTPGDSYLWYTNKKDKPIKVKMWVSIIPIGGIAFKWSDYKKLKSGALIARNHEGLLFNVKLKNIKSGSDLNEIGLKKDPFQSYKDKMID